MRTLFRGQTRLTLQLGAWKHKLIVTIPLGSGPLRPVARLALNRGHMLLAIYWTPTHAPWKAWEYALDAQLRSRFEVMPHPKDA